MTTVKNCVLAGFIIRNQQDGLMADIVFEFKNGCFGKRLDASEKVSDILEEFDATVPDMGVKIIFLDYVRRLALSCAAWDSGNFILRDAVESFEDETKKFILSLFSGISPDCNIENQGGNDMARPSNSLLPNSYAPAEMKKYSNSGVDFAGDRIQDGFAGTLYLSSDIAAIPNRIASYTNDWTGEDEREIVPHAHYYRLDECLLKNDHDEVDISCGTLLHSSDAWDENTIISLKGNMRNRIKIDCRLKNLPLFRGIGKSSTISSGIQDDINILMRVGYKKHCDMHDLKPEQFVPVRNLMLYNGSAKEILIDAQRQVEELKQNMFAKNKAWVDLQTNLRT